LEHKSGNGAKRHGGKGSNCRERRGKASTKAVVPWKRKHKLLGLAGITVKNSMNTGENKA
jgi:hypothetical protein